MADEPFDPSCDELVWMQAAAFMDLHGDRWPDEAVTALRAATADRRDNFERWNDLVDKMIAIAGAPRQ